jgi:hypothetical protein
VKDLWTARLVLVDGLGSEAQFQVATQAATKPRNATLRIRMPPTLGRLRRLLPLPRECFNLGLLRTLANPLLGRGEIQLSLQLPCQSATDAKKVSTSISSRYLPLYSCASYQSRKKVAQLLSVDISYSVCARSRKKWLSIQELSYDTWLWIMPPQLAGESAGDALEGLRLSANDQEET